MSTAAINELRPYRSVYGLQVVCLTFDNYLLKHPHVFDNLEQVYAFSNKAHAKGVIQLDLWLNLNDLELSELTQIMMN